MAVVDLVAILLDPVLQFHGVQYLVEVVLGLDFDGPLADHVRVNLVVDVAVGHDAVMFVDDDGEYLFQQWHQGLVLLAVPNEVEPKIVFLQNQVFERQVLRLDEHLLLQLVGTLVVGDLLDAVEAADVLQLVDEHVGAPRGVDVPARQDLGVNVEDDGVLVAYLRVVRDPVEELLVESRELRDDVLDPVTILAHVRHPIELRGLLENTVFVLDVYHHCLQLLTHHVFLEGGVEVLQFLVSLNEQPNPDSRDRRRPTDRPRDNLFDRVDVVLVVDQDYVVDVVERVPLLHYLGGHENLPEAFVPDPDVVQLLGPRENDRLQAHFDQQFVHLFDGQTLVLDVLRVYPGASGVVELAQELLDVLAHVQLEGTEHVVALVHDLHRLADHLLPVDVGVLVNLGYRLLVYVEHVILYDVADAYGIVPEDDVLFLHQFERVEWRHLFAGYNELARPAFHEVDGSPVLVESIVSDPGMDPQKCGQHGVRLSHVHRDFTRTLAVFTGHIASGHFVTRA